MVEVERARDAQAGEAQARRVALDLVGRTEQLPNGSLAFDFHVRIINDSPEPLTKARLRVVDAGELKWGPQLIGTIRAVSEAGLIARIYENVTDPNAFLRFADVQGNYWVASARDPVKRDDRTTDEWVAEGRKLWASRTLSPEERGTLTGSTVDRMPDFDEWLASSQSNGDAWSPDPEARE
jgi:hypothetical protein